VHVDIEPERPADHAAIGEVVRAAFSHHQSVSRLVELVRESPHFLPELSLVARRDGAVVGHVMISRAHLRDDAQDTTHDVLTLSPLAVAPAAQGDGIGSSLVRAALAGAQSRPEPLITLEGSPRYYPRFGFRDCRELGITIALPTWAPPEAGMVRTLPSYTPSVRGQLVYPTAFSTYEQA
jgi:putative acetyltransferase